MFLTLHSTRGVTEAMSSAPPAATALGREWPTPGWAQALEEAGIALAVLSPDGHYRQANAAFCALVGLSADALAGVHHFVRFPNGEFEREFARAAVAGESVSCRARPFQHGISPFDGALAIDWTLTPVVDPTAQRISAVLLTALDVSQRNRAMETSRLREEAVSALLESVPGSVYRADSSWRIRSMTEAVRLCGYTADEINARPGGWLDLVHPDDRAAVRGARFTLPQTTRVDRYRIVHRDGSVVTVEDRKRLVMGEGDRFVDGIVFDVSDEQLLRQALLRSEERHRAVIETSADGFWMIGRDGVLLDVNDTYCRQSGYTREELLGMRIDALEGIERPDETAAHVEAVIRSGGDLFETLHRRKDGSLWPVEVSTTYWPAQEGRLFCFVRDVERRQRSETLLATRVQLNALAVAGDLDGLLQVGVNAAERLTHSTIGYFHFVALDEQTLHLQAWSTQTLSTRCAAQGKGQHYPVGNAGLWADALRERQAVLCNDYSAAARKGGLPAGHAPISRFISVPIWQEGRIAALIGVGNKAAEYGVGDVDLCSRVGEAVLEAVAQVRARRRQAELEAMLESAQSVARVGSVRIDFRSDHMLWSPEMRELIDLPVDAPLDRAAFLAMIPASQRTRVEDAWRRLAEGVPFTFDHPLKPLRAPGSPVRWAEQRGTVLDWRDGRPATAIVTLQDITGGKAAQVEIERLANYDSLTGLPNRAMFRRQLRKIIERTGRGHARAGLLLIDLDRFKDLNEVYGHDVGDHLLVEVASRLSGVLREVDLLARLGGDEFAVLLDGLSAPTDVVRVANAVLGAVNGQRVDVGHGTTTLSLSMGISIFPDDGQSAEVMLAHADAALYQAKSRGRGSFSFYTEGLTERVQERLTLEAGLRRALAGKELELFYQPLLAGGEQAAVNGVEALLRWHDPQSGGLIGPDRFIPVAEDSGLIVPIGAWVINTACQAMAGWRAAGRPVRYVAVNISARQFELSDLVGTVTQALADAALPGDCLELEITESLLIDRDARVLETLQRLHALGVRLAIDDFGTGYSSLTYLKRFPIDKLKIDRGFIIDLPGDEASGELVQAVIAMAQALKLDVIAEGVETADQWHYLAAHGCAAYQGFYFGRPVPAARLFGADG